VNIARFHDLAQAYGADLRRWPRAQSPPAPTEHQAAAGALAQTAEGRAALSAAGELDDWLDASRPAAPSFALRDRVLASAPSPKAGGLGWTFNWGLKAGLSAGLTSAGIAGIVAGFALNTSAMEPGELALSTLAAPATSTAFGPAPEAAAELQVD
jgi:hypothetical protein